MCRRFQARVPPPESLQLKWPSMARLKKLAVAACVVQFLITVGIPLMQFFLVSIAWAPCSHALPMRVSRCCHVCLLTFC